MRLRNGKWLLLSAGLSVLGLTACDDSDSHLEKCGEDFKAVCVGDANIMICQDGELIVDKCVGVCLDDVCQGKAEDLCTKGETACGGGKLLTCVGDSWMASDCASGEVCVVDACVIKASCTGSEKACQDGKLMSSGLPHLLFPLKQQRKKSLASRPRNHSRYRVLWLSSFGAIG